MHDLVMIVNCVLFT